MVAYHHVMKITDCLQPIRVVKINQKAWRMSSVKMLCICSLLFLAGCTSFSKTNHLSLFQDVHRAYRLALRDSDFKAAKLVLDPATSARADMDTKPYEGIKVARYKVIKTSANSHGSEVRQEVEIQYYRQTRPVVKYLMDKQIWRYHSDNKNWYLDSGLPEFE